MPPYACHLQDSWIEILDNQVFITFASRFHHPRPTHDHRLTDSSLIGGAFTTVQGIVLRMDLAVTPSGLAGKTTVIAHEDHDRVIRLAILLQPVHQIAQTLIHTLYQGSVSRLFSR